MGANALPPPDAGEEPIINDTGQPGAYLSAFHGPDGTELESRHGFFLGPHGLVMDAKRDVLIVADRLNHRVVALRRTTLELVWQHGKTAEPGAGADRLYYPHGVALDHAQLLVHVADCRNHRVVSLLAADGTFVSAFGGGGGGGGVASRLTNPSSVCTTPDGCVWVADSGNHRVVCFNARSQPWVPLLQLGGSAGGGAGAAGSRINQFSNPFGVAHMLDVGRSLVLVADAGNHRVQVFDALTGLFVRMLGSGDGGDASTRRLCEPVSVCVAHNVVYVCEWGAARVAAFAAADFRPLGTFGGGGGLLSGVRCLCVTPDGAEAFVTDSKQHRVAVFRAY